MLTLILFASLASLFAAVFLLSMSTTIVAGNRISVKHSINRLNGYAAISAIDEELSEPFLDRVIIPFMRVFTEIGHKLTPKGFIDGIEHKLVLAGFAKDSELDRFLAYKGFASLFGLAFSALFVIGGGFSASQLVMTTLTTAGCFFLPDLWLKSKITARQKMIRLALPDTLDLLTISVEAGLGFDAALQKVVNNTNGPLAEECYRLLQEIQLGTVRSQAFRNLGERTEVDELGSFILAMLQAEVFGISIGKVLRVQAKELRIKRRQRAEEMAQKAPVKILFPLIMCIFPSVMVVIMGPAVIQIYETIFKSF